MFEAKCKGRIINNMDIKIRLEEEDSKILEKLKNETDADYEKMLTEFAYGGLNKFFNCFRGSLDKCKLVPSNKEIAMFIDEHYELNNEELEEAVRGFIDKNTKEVLLIDEIVVLGEPYAKVYEINTNKFIRVPLGLLIKES